MALVQSVGKSSFLGTNATNTITAGANFNGSHAVIVAFEYYTASITGATGVTIAGTAATKLAGGTISSQGSEIWWAPTNAGGSANVVITWGAGQHDGFASVVEWSGVSGFDVKGEVAQTPASLAPSVSTDSTTTVTPTLLVGVSASVSFANPNTYTQPAGWTGLGTESDGGGTNSGATAYLEDSGAVGVKTATWAQTDSATSYNCIAAFSLASNGISLAWIQA